MAKSGRLCLSRQNDRVTCSSSCNRPSAPLPSHHPPPPAAVHLPSARIHHGYLKTSVSLQLHLCCTMADLVHRSSRRPLLPPICDLPTSRSRGSETLIIRDTRCTCRLQSISTRPIWINHCQPTLWRPTIPPSDSCAPFVYQSSDSSVQVSNLAQPSPTYNCHADALTPPLCSPFSSINSALAYRISAVCSANTASRRQRQEIQSVGFELPVSAQHLSAIHHRPQSSRRRAKNFL